MKYSKENLVIYHENCFDGMTAAWLFWKVFGEENTNYHPADYSKPGGKEIPENQAKNIYIVDYAYSLEVLKKQAAKCEKLLVLDHHESAIKELAGYENAILDENKSGAGIVFQYLKTKYPHSLYANDAYLRNSLALFVHYVQDRDTWTFESPNTESFTARMALSPMTLKDWSDLFDHFVQDEFGFLHEGKLLLQQHRNNIDKFIKLNLIWIKLFGRQYPIINLPKEYGSDACSEILKRHPEVDFAMYYFEDSLSYTKGPYIGIRSRKNGPVNVRIFAEHFGGGGHPSASAFRTPLDKVRMLEFEKDLYQKMLGEQ